MTFYMIQLSEFTGNYHTYINTDTDSVSDYRHDCTGVTTSLFMAQEGQRAGAGGQAHDEFKMRTPCGYPSGDSRLI